MRPLELATVLSVSAAAVLLLLGRTRTIAAWIGVASFLVLLLHLLLEGPRLQALPIYIAVAIVAFCLISRATGLLLVTGSAIAGVLTALGALACYVYPVFAFPEPGGPYAIGTHTFYLTDANRIERYAKSGEPHRRLVSQIWYPASHCDGPKSVYRDPRTLIWKSAHLRYVKTHACVDAPVLNAAPGRPVVFFSPSSGGFRGQNTFLTEYLVSRGYVVVGLDHPDTCARVAFPDGSIVHSLPNVWLDLGSRAGLAKSTPKTEDILRTNVQDIQFVYGLMRGGSSNAKLQSFARQIDFSRCAAIGHSFGGAAVAELCRIDSRFKAGINLDGWMFSGVRREGVLKPFLFMVEDDPLWFENNGPFEDNLAGVIRLGTADYKKTILQSVTGWGGSVARLGHGTHTDFADMSLFTRPYPWQTADRPLPEEKHATVNQIVLAFLDEQLRGKSGALSKAAEATAPACELTTYAASLPKPEGRLDKVVPLE